MSGLGDGWIVYTNHLGQCEWKPPFNYIISLNSNGGTAFSNFVGVANNSNTYFNASVTMPISGTIKTFYASLATAPGTGNTRTLTMFHNDATTGITIAINGTSTSGSNLVGSFTVVAGDTISCQLTGAGGGASSVQMSFLFSNQ